MKRPLQLFRFLVLMLLTTALSGQERTISGRVVGAADQVPIPNVSVVIKGTTTGVPTDPDGKYQLTIPENGTTLVFRFIGYVTQEVVIGSQTVVDVQLTEEATKLGDVIVTAQGIAREKRALGFALSEVKSESIEQRPESNVQNILRGKIPGVQITSTGGMLGSRSDVVIRGVSSINGDNQPLYIVDGVFYEGNRIGDLDPNNIDDVQVLKGLAASSLYGQEGRNGVIIFTTKTAAASATEDLSITVSQQYYVNQITGLPDFQNTYGQGSDNVPNTGFVGNFGGRFDDNFMVPHHLDQPRFAEAFPQFQGQEVLYQAYPNQIKDFFNNGSGGNTSLLGNARVGKSSIGFSVGYNSERGYIESNKSDRLNLSLSANTQLADKLNLQSSFAFSNNVLREPPGDIFNRTLFLPRNLDLNGLPFESPIDGSSIWYRTDADNPLWQEKNHVIGSDANRIFMKIGLTYDVTNFLKFGYRVGYDNYVTESFQRENYGGVRYNAGLGFYNQSSFTRSNYDHNFLLNTTGLEINEDLIITSQVGFNMRSINTRSFGLNSTEQVVFGFFRHDNFLSYQPAGDSKQRTNVLGLYGQTELSFRDYAFLTLSGRNDWGSQVERENASLFYPSASASFIMSDALPDMVPDFVDFLKFRLGYGSSAGFPSSYRTRAVLGSDPIRFVSDRDGNITANFVSSTQPNPNLKPERQKEIEFGVETTLFNGLLDVDMSYYNRISEDQIFSSNLPPSTGFTSTSINAGRIDTEGLELGVTVFPVRTGNLTYSITNNFTAYETTVKELPEELVEYSGNNTAIVGQPLGVFRSTFIVRDDEGNALINPANGNFIISSDVGLDQKVTGDPNPDFRYSMIHGFTYKGFNLTVQLEYTHGGDMASSYVSSIYERGVTTDTEDREGSFYLPGVYGDVTTGEPLKDESGNKIPNRYQLTLNDIFFTNAFTSYENSMFDASVFRIREINLNYNLPNTWVNRIGLNSASITGNIQNVFWYAPHFPKGIRLDPEANTSGENGFGEQGISDPAMRKFSVGLRVTF